ncbi:GTPase [uncultured Thiodictyon sp.]|uniref:YcjF family protein n=1 Tax=uncultured Thiodictyon sp. TaxID=1846217 RepID=UPI0025DEDB50|nr:GTPase [uncultured Thiodictyon sp.]
MNQTQDPKQRWYQDWRGLRERLLHPRVDDAALETALRRARERQPLPVIWLVGKAQAGKTSIIRALTGSPNAEIGTGFRPCTRTARFYDFPSEAPLVRFLDTRGLGEVAYDPTEDIRYCESQAHLVLGVMKASDLNQESIFTVLGAVRRRHPHWPVLIAQTGLHEAYPPDAGHLRPYPYDRQPWPPAVPPDLVRALLAQREALGALPGASPAQWVPVDLTLPEDGLEPANYGLEALWAAIGEVSTLGLKALLCADAGVRDTFARAAHPHIVGHATAAAAVGALPLVDLVAVPAVQAKLLHSLAAIYGQGWGGREVSEFLGFLGVGVGVSYLTRFVGRELVKLVPYLGQTLGAVWGATASGATTFALGKAACYYFGRRRLGERIDPGTLRRIYSEALVTGTRLITSNTTAGATKSGKAD